MNFSKSEERKLETLLQTELLEGPPPPYDQRVRSSPASSSSNNSASSSDGLIYPPVPPRDTIIVVNAPTATGPRLQYQNATLIVDQGQQPRKRSWFVDTISDGEAWLAVLYFMFVGFPMAVFGFCWCIPTVIVGLVSWIFPPIGAILWIGFAYSWRLTARFELITLEMCGKPFRRYDPQRLTYIRPRYSPVLRIRSTNSHACGVHGMLSRIWDLSTDPHTFASVLYFIGFNFLFTTFAFCIIVPLFCCSMTLMICCMPLCCIVAKELAMYKIKIAHKMLIQE
ncbi:hypothetical protein BC936DRAFT_143916 [Jimgerdemannia flammicorona]|uniref:Uncharacterized protein n=1 Tax=Jimgerdemannia flammicorona TaxID=994334 RepID=A0A432ZYG1_9FUNG|nr:hypothetical protein BC936DRAFT_143916 [Jimgerdemannia flammicorona]